VVVNRAGWATGSFLAYTGALMALVAAVAWLSVISHDHSQGAFAGWSVLFWIVAEAFALWLLRRGRRVVAGLFAFVGLGLFAVMVGAFFSWFGWLPHDKPLGGFHVGLLLLQLLVLAAALVHLGIFKFPLFMFVLAGLGWYFFTDLVSSGGNWSAWVTLFVGLFLFVLGLGQDGGDTRPYGFWVHVVAGLTIGGALLYWWHSSDFQWALIIVVGLLFMAVGAGLRRSSYGVIGTIGLVLASGHYAIGNAFLSGDRPSAPSSWAGPVAFLCLGVFLALVGMALWRRDRGEIAAQ
jgi:peptidoglycan/LPS O-acetylase OafA/YrhL